MSLEQERVFMRTDFNVPLKDGMIMSDFRLQAVRPTIDYLLEKQAYIVLATHLGRPQGPDLHYSTKQLIPWFLDHGYAIEFAENPTVAAQKSKEKKSHLILLENLRFFPGEKKQDEAFALQLKSCGDIFVNDAFGTLHRNETSLTLLPALYEQDKKTIGFLIEKEITHLNKLINDPKKPFITILGGGKIKTKLPFIESIVKKVDHILLCPALVFTILHALGIPTGKSLVDEEALDAIKTFLTTADAQKIVLPSDFQVALENINSALITTEGQAIPENGIGTAIGPKTTENFCTHIQKAKTVFFNAAMGFPTNPATMQATQQLLEALATSKAYTVVGGGDSVAAAFNANVAEKIDFLSTGGGATLAYLSGQKLPGLAYM